MLSPVAVFVLFVALSSVALVYIFGGAWLKSREAKKIERARIAEDAALLERFNTVSVQEASGRMAKGYELAVERREPLYVASGGKRGCFRDQAVSPTYGSPC